MAIISIRMVSHHLFKVRPSDVSILLIESLLPLLLHFESQDGVVVAPMVSGSRALEITVVQRDSFVEGIVIQHILIEDAIVSNYDVFVGVTQRNRSQFSPI